MWHTNTQFEALRILDVTDEQEAQIQQENTNQFRDEDEDEWIALTQYVMICFRSRCKLSVI